MRITINGMVAAIKENTSFEFVEENRLFSGSDGYSLAISFPLRGCMQNLAIFGHINRSDVAANKAVFDCTIRDRSFVKHGSIVITEINEAEVKTQFLEGGRRRTLILTSTRSISMSLTSVRPTICRLHKSRRRSLGTMGCEISPAWLCHG